MSDYDIFNKECLAMTGETLYVIVSSYIEASNASKIYKFLLG